jgi:hypothetical protein
LRKRFVGAIAADTPAAQQQPEPAATALWANRKQLTVMFCDLAGSNAWPDGVAARIDPMRCLRCSNTYAADARLCEEGGAGLRVGGPRCGAPVSACCKAARPRVYRARRCPTNLPRRARIHHATSPSASSAAGRRCGAASRRQRPAPQIICKCRPRPRRSSFRPRPRS